MKLAVENLPTESFACQGILLRFMANDSTVFSFQMNDMYQLHWPPNDVYGCSQNTLTQLQEKVLRSLSKKQEDDNLQVVPENDCVFKDDSPSPFLGMQETVYREKSAAKESYNTSCNRKEPKAGIQRNLNFPWSPRFHKSPFLDTFSSAEPLRTPTFPFSPLTKSPGHFSTPASPLAMMLLSPFGRKPSEDLSMYLPENFTPAATLERLENSVSTTVFEFPSVEPGNRDECKVEELKSGKDEGKITDAVKIDDDGGDDNVYVNAQDVFVDINDNSGFGEQYDFDETSDLTQNKGRRKRAKQNENEGNGNVVVGFRNKLERKRRSEMNSKYDKLRRCIPEIEKRQKVSKILVLKSAVQYIQELQRQDELLTKQKNIEKLKNDELLKNLVKISS